MARSIEINIECTMNSKFFSFCDRERMFSFEMYEPSMNYDDIEQNVNIEIKQQKAQQY